MAIKCNKCEQMCGLLYFPTAALPKDNDKPIPGETPTGEEVDDIRQYCLENYKES